MKKIKDALYSVKEWLKIVYQYPKQTIVDRVNYDDYWKLRRGSDAVAWINDWQKERLAIVASLVGSGKSSYADIACGEGSMLAVYKEKYGDLISSVSGVDSSPVALELASNYGIDAHHMDVSDASQYEKLPHADHMWLFEILEHLPEPETLLRACYQNCQRSVFISVPNSGFIIYRLRLLFGKVPMQWGEHPGEHLRFWTIRDMRWWIEALGYTEFRIVPYKGVPILNRFLPNLFAAGMMVQIVKKG